MQREGTMLAMNGTVQGASGWYELEVQDREGWYAVKYQVDANENWTCIKGPLPEVDYQVEVAREEFKEVTQNLAPTIRVERSLHGRIDEAQKAEPLLAKMGGLKNSTEMLELLTGHLQSLLNDARAHYDVVTKDRQRLVTVSQQRIEAGKRQQSAEAATR
jgi:hypothetical protein